MRSGSSGHASTRGGSSTLGESSIGEGSSSSGGNSQFSPTQGGTGSSGASPGSLSADSARNGGESPSSLSLPHPAPRSRHAMRRKARFPDSRIEHPILTSLSMTVLAHSGMNKFNHPWTEVESGAVWDDRGPGYHTTRMLPIGVPHGMRALHADEQGRPGPTNDADPGDVCGGGAAVHRRAPTDHVRDAAIGLGFSTFVHWRANAIFRGANVLATACRHHHRFEDQGPRRGRRTGDARKLTTRSPSSTGPDTARPERVFAVRTARQRVHCS